MHECPFNKEAIKLDRRKVGCSGIGAFCHQ